MQIRKITALSLITAATLSACSVGEQQREAIEKVRDNLTEIEKSLEDSRDDSVGKRVRFHDEVYLSATAIENKHGDPLPRGYEDMAMYEPHPQTIEELADKLSGITNIPVRVEGRLGAPETDPATTSQLPIDASGNPFRVATPFVSQTSLQNGEEALKKRVKYEGTLEGLVNVIANLFGYDWVFEDGILRFVRFSTETFTIHAFGGSTELETSIETVGGGQSGGSGGQSLGGNNDGSDVSANGSQRTIYNNSIDIWPEIESTIEALLPEESVVVVSEATSTVTVSAPAWAMGSVRTYIKEYNNRISRRVALKVDVFSVSLREGQSLGVGGQLSFLDASTGLGLALRGISPTLNSTADVLSGSVISPTNNDTLAKFDGSTIVAELLREQGEVSLVDRLTVLTTNQRPAPVAFTNRRGFLRSSSTSALGDSARVSLQPGVVSTGFVMNLVPNIFEDGNMFLHIAANLSELVDLTNIEAGGTLIQTPEVNSRDLMLNTYVGSGEAIVLTGFESTRDARDEEDQGLGVPITGFFKSGRSERLKLYVVIQPFVLKSPVALADAQWK